MVIDFTPELVPFLWGILAALLLATGAILLCIDRESAQRNPGSRRLVVASSAVALSPSDAEPWIHLNRRGAAR